MFYIPTTFNEESNLYPNNWSGYAALLQGSCLDTVSAGWIISEISFTKTRGYCSIGVGIGRFLERSGSRLIQVGTKEDVRNDGIKDY
jgi:hypothetical protein